MKSVAVFAMVGTLLLGGYAWSEAVGWEPSPTVRQRIEPSVRQSPGGWRSWTFWHRGVHGGK